MKHIIHLLTLLFLVPALYAAEDKLPLLLEEETLLVAYVDFARIDAAELVKNNRPIIEKVLGETGFYSPEMLQEFFPDENQRQAVEATIRDWDAISKLIAGGKAFLAMTFGIDDAYFVLRLRGLGFDVAYVAIPKTPKLNVAMLKSTFASSELGLRETGDFVLIAFKQQFGNEENQKHYAENFGPARVRPRGDFLEARKEVKNYPVQILYAVPDFAKKVLNDTKPFLDEPFDKINLAKLIGGVRYKAIGLDPAKPEVYAVAQAESELAAQELYFGGRAIFELGYAWWEKHLEEIAAKVTDEHDKRFFESLRTLLTWENLEKFQKTLIPKPQATRFAVRWDAATIQSGVESMTPLIAPMIQAPILASREAARRMQCTNNLKQLALAVHTYHDAHGVLPQPYTVDSNGKPLHSWRVTLLPYLESYALYEAIRKDEPWDSEYNKQFHDKMPVVLRCPSCRLGDAKSGTTYFMVVGEETFGQVPKPDAKKYTFSRVSDGTSNTIAIVERKEPVCWMAPVDIPQEVAYQGINQSNQGIGSFHRGGINCVFLDGSVQFISDTIELKILKACLTIAGGEAGWSF